MSLSCSFIFISRPSSSSSSFSSPAGECLLVIVAISFPLFFGLKACESVGLVHMQLACCWPCSSCLGLLNSAPVWSPLQSAMGICGPSQCWCYWSMPSFLLLSFKSSYIRYNAFYRNYATCHHCPPPLCCCACVKNSLQKKGILPKFGKTLPGTLVWLLFFVIVFFSYASIYLQTFKL